MAKIMRLPSDVIQRIRTGVTAPSMGQVVEELVCNALDAGASCIRVHTKLECFCVEVWDNGCGIAEEDMELIGERYYTSKGSNLAHQSPTSYGYRGEAIASCRDIGTVHIVSRAGAGVTLQKLMDHVEVLSLGPASIARSEGTTVSVRNIFTRFPVRRQRMDPQSELDNIVARLYRLALVNTECSISLVDGPDLANIMRTQKASNVAARFGQLFGSDGERSLVPCHVSDEPKDDTPLSVRGYLSIKPYHNRRLQFLYVNQRPVLNTRLHKCLQQQFLRSTICEANSGQYPIYVINIECDPKDCDICFEPAKTLVEFRQWTRILNLIRLLTAEIFNEHGLFPVDRTLSYYKSPLSSMVIDDRIENHLKNPLIESPMETNYPRAKPTTIKVPNLFEYTAPQHRGVQTSRVVSSKRHLNFARMTPDSSALLTQTISSHSVSKVTLTPSRMTLSKKRHFNQLSAESDSTSARINRVSSLSASVLAPYTFNVDNNKRSFEEETRMTPPPMKCDLNAQVLVQPQDKDMSVNAGPRRRKRSRLDNKLQNDNGSTTVNASDDTTVLKPDRHGVKDGISGSHRAIPRSTSSLVEPTSKPATISPSGLSFELSALKQSSVPVRPLKFTKEMVGQLRVVANCDKKFIVCTLDGKNEDSSLIFVDQHAADERVQLERLQNAFFQHESNGGTSGVLTTAVTSQPVSYYFDLSQGQAALLSHYKKKMTWFGLKLKVDNVTVHVTQAPSVLVGFGSGKIKGLIVEHLELLRGTAGGGGRVMPKIMLDVLKSQACRLAFKFGDDLSLVECRNLMANLANTDLPFQCAHGRPSIAPICVLPNESSV